jgi:hypothetical protein
MLKITNMVTNSMEKLIVALLVKKSQALRITSRFITVFTRALQWALT